MDTIVQGPNHQSQFSKVGVSDLIYMKHQLQGDSNGRRVLDVFSSLGSFNIADITPGHVKFKRGNTDHQSSPANWYKVGLFVPFFSIIDWMIDYGTVGFEAWIFTDLNFDPKIFKIPMEPFIFPISEPPPKIKTMGDIAKYLNIQKEILLIGRASQVDQRCRLLKQKIDLNFKRSDFSIIEEIKNLDLTQEAMTRYFKKTMACHHSPTAIDCDSPKPISILSQKNAL